MQKMRTYYQNKLNALKRVLDIYQEKVERRSALCEEKLKVVFKSQLHQNSLNLNAIFSSRNSLDLIHYSFQSLQRVNERLQDERKALQERNRHDSATWEREKVLESSS